MSSGPLGQGIHHELEGAHEFLADLEDKRDRIHAQLRAIVDEIANLDATHDRKARGLYYAFDSLLEVTDNKDHARVYLELKTKLFPLGLRIVRMPYIEEGGSAEKLDRAVGQETRAQLASIVVGEHNLGQIFNDWIRAGLALGRAVNQRAELQASLTRQGSAVDQVDIRAGRKRWLQAVRGLLWGIEMRPELGVIAEAVEASLTGAIDTSRRRRGAGAKEVGGEEQEDELEDDASGEDEAEDELADELVDEDLAAARSASADNGGEDEPDSEDASDDDDDEFLEESA